MKHFLKTLGIPALLLAAAVCTAACGSLNGLGAKPTVEADTIPASEESAVGAVTARSAQDAPYRKGLGFTAEPAATDLAPQAAANRAAALYRDVGGESGSQPWLLNYLPAGTAPGLNGGRSAYLAAVYADGKSMDESTLYFDCILDGITGRPVQFYANWPLADIWQALALTDGQSRQLADGQSLSAAEYANLDAVYQPMAEQARHWQSTQMDDYAALVKSAVGLADADWQRAAPALPGTAQEYLEGLYAADRPGAPARALAVPTYRVAQNGAPYVLEMGTAVEKAVWFGPEQTDDGGTFLVEDDGSWNYAQIPPMPEQKPGDEGWYEQAGDGSWYHVDRNGVPDGAASGGTPATAQASAPAANAPPAGYKT